MNCSEAQRRIPGYFDGVINAADHVRLCEHLRACGNCREELEYYRLLTAQLASLEPVATPADLAVRIRISALEHPSPWSGVYRLWSRAVLAFHNIWEPLAVPATGGILTALVIFALVVESLVMGIPMGRPVPNDQPLNLVQPAELEELAPFPVSTIMDATARGNSGGLTVEATVNASGQVLSYKILSGPHSEAVLQQIDQILLFSRFRPELSFGRPTSGGHVFLNFDQVRVRG
ncbi:MAG: zf-HC2 domain-containing protein [Acidobacteriota bacterium]|nr:zf-HC2 domain-containing protein [Acidobacteriota bacterium]MDE3171169.1 zf-HC2 domain-containing protein [Acidobacteriota bacterium]